MKLDLRKVTCSMLSKIAEKMIGARDLLCSGEFLCNKGILYVGTQNDEPFLLLGVYPLWRGVAEAYVLSREAEGIESVPIFTLRSFRRVIKIAFETMDLHRLQIVFSPADHCGMGMSEAAGFQSEGVMRCYTHDRQDRLRMAIVRESSCR